jgi:hypothetical protein
VTLPLNKNAITAARPSNLRGRTGYNVPPPTIKQEVADRIRAVERAAVRPPARASRCCGRCKTPYNCGRPGCPCHG